jgi:hypothetical protein
MNDQGSSATFFTIAEESDLAMKKPKKEYCDVFFYYNEMPKYIPMKPEFIARLSSEDRQEYENSLKI